VEEVSAALLAQKPGVAPGLVGSAGPARNGGERKGTRRRSGKAQGAAAERHKAPQRKGTRRRSGKAQGAAHTL